MTDTRRIGGVAGLLHALALLGPAIVLPLAGLTHDDLSAPAKALTHPVAMAFYSSFNMLWGATCIVLALALYGQMGALREAAQVRVATCIGVLGGLLFIVQGATGTIGVPVIAGAYSQHPVAASANLDSLQTFTTNVLMVALIVYGIWLLVISWYAVKAKVFSRALNYTGFFWGLVALIGFAFLWLLGPIWAIWLGVSFLRASGSGALALSDASAPQAPVTAAHEP